MVTKAVQLGTAGASVHVSTGGFAGPFGIHVDAFDEGPRLQVETARVKLVRGETEVLKLDLIESSNEAPLNNVVLVTYVGDVVADVDEQGLTVMNGGVNTAKLTISVGRDAVSDETSRLVLSSANAPPVSIAVDLVEPERDEVPTIIYWLAIAILFILVIAFFALPKVSKRGQV